MDEIAEAEVAETPPDPEKEALEARLAQTQIFLEQTRDELAAEKAKAEELAKAAATSDAEAKTLAARVAQVEAIAQEKAEAAAAASTGAEAAIRLSDEATASLASVTKDSLDRRLEFETTLERLRLELATVTQERNNAIHERENSLQELLTVLAQRMVDRLELPWDGAEALPKQLDALLARLKAAEGKGALVAR